MGKGDGERGQRARQDERALERARVRVLSLSLSLLLTFRLLSDFSDAGPLFYFSSLSSLSSLLPTYLARRLVCLDCLLFGRDSSSD